MAFQTPYDIANRALQHLGATLITTFADNSKNAAQAGFIYDKLRRAELRANPWNFSRRRAVLRQLTDPSYIVGIQPWVFTTNYSPGDIVIYAGAYWISLVGGIGQTPGIQAGYWVEYTGAVWVPQALGSNYYAGELAVTGGTNVSVLTIATSGPPGAVGWHPVLGAVVLPLLLFSPLGYTTNLLPNSSKNVYPLPPAYVRNMMQDPKAAGTPAQITTGGAQALDYEIEQGFLLTSATGPIVFRYGADLQLVPWFDPLFGEALAARMAVELNETITQSPQKAQICNGLYEEAIGKAIRVNAIEAGSTEPDGDKVDSQRGPTREKMPPQPRQQ